MRFNLSHPDWFTRQVNQSPKPLVCSAGPQTSLSLLHLDWSTHHAVSHVAVGLVGLYSPQTSLSLLRLDWSTHQ